MQSGLSTLQSQLTPYANGSMIGNNPALQAQLDQIASDTTNQVNSQFAAAGRDGSGMNQQTLARGIAQGEAPVIAGQYNQDVANQLSAANALYGAQNSTSGLLSGLTQQGLANQLQGVTSSQDALNRVIADPAARASPAPRAQQDLWHYTIAKMVDACMANGIKAFYGPFGDFSDGRPARSQFRNAFLMGCAGAWTLHPSQVAIAKRVFAPDPAEVAFAARIVAAMPDGTGAVMLDGKMQDDATWKQAKVIVDLAKLVAAKDPELAAVYKLG